MSEKISEINLSPVLEKSKEFEYLVSTYDPAYDNLVTTIELIKQFIIENKLIVYGGTAIDMALRLKGDKIYPDDLLAIPDLDFYSSKNVEHAYQLADILYKHGYKEARAINAQHMETMRVDLMDNHFIADITYRPPEVFEKLPYLTYNGMRIIHPDFQRIDVHSSLSFPFDNPPREVIFERWSKDIKRFNKLANVYPISPPKDVLSLREVSIRGIRQYVLSGFAAYAAIYNEFAREMKKLGAEIPKDIISAKFQVIEDQITFETLDQTCELVHFNLQKAAGELEITNIRQFEPYINLIPARLEGLYDNKPIIIHSTKNRLISINSIDVNGAHLRIVNVQFLLKHFLSMYFVHDQTPKTAAVYLSRYISLLAMINTICQAFINTPQNTIKTSILFPTVQPFGNENINLAREIALNRLYHELDNVPMYKIPQNYYPARAAERGTGPPAFNAEDIEFFHESGREILSNTNINN